MPLTPLDLWSDSSPTSYEHEALQKIGRIGLKLGFGAISLVFLSVCCLFLIDLGFGWLRKVRHILENAQVFLAFLDNTKDEEKKNKASKGGFETVL